ncbi:MAG: hypothetical protein KGI97_06975 [Alphaproteobacteria bacterium]|nr:hypothetical protein [Alphaproteobacteria bacterium]
MTDMTEDEDFQARRKKGGDTGEGDADSFGRGKAGAGAGGGIKLSAQMMKRVVAEFRQLDVNELMDAVVEFFSEKLRASANLVVNFAKNSSGDSKGFTVVNAVIDAGRSAVREFARTRGNDARGLKQKQKPGFGMKPGLSPSGPTGQ